MPKDKTLRRSPEDHYRQTWKVHGLLEDFRIEDVWNIPVQLNETDSIPEFRKKMNQALDEFTKSGIAGFLFQFRLFLGKIFGWDNNSENLIESAGSIRSRYANRNNIPISQLIPLEGADFEPVYEFGDEFLSEIENATVHAALHLGKIALDNDTYTIDLTVYVKPKGMFGRIYMKIIQLPRHLIIYPLMLKTIAKAWNQTKDQNEVQVQVG